MGRVETGGLRGEAAPCHVADGTVCDLIGHLCKDLGKALVERPVGSANSSRNNSPGGERS